jgi:hypothetical protein
MRLTNLFTPPEVGNSAITPFPKREQAIQGKGETMAEPQETRQEQEARWTAQRAAREQESRAGQQARRKKHRRTWATVGAIVLIVVVIAAVVLL